MGGLFNKFLAHVMPGVVRPLRVLFNEIVGFVFLVLAAWAVPSVVRTLREFDGNADSILRTAVALGFSALMAYFAITSFLRARRISRS